MYIFFISMISGASAADSAGCFLNTVWGDIKAAGSDGLFMAGNALHPSTAGMISISATIAGTALCATIDDEVRSLALRNRTDKGVKFFDVTNEFGDVYKVGLFTGGLYLTGLISGSDEIRTTARLAAESALLSGLITTSLKYIIGRARPVTNEGNDSFHWFEIEDRYESLPSGHSTATMAVITVIAGRIDRWWAYGLYAIPAVTMMSRIYRDGHWFSDVFAGAAIGTLSGIAVLNAEESGNKPANTGLLILPDGYGILLSYRF
ncbi:MAG TPA: phosphatase PAP2 family protein [Ignavibacteriales bacterium]|nr:phosphatase PAP2 family protein [Ignavibacteriales bacterium]